MESQLDGFDEEPKIRPTLLTVLCILTFVGSSWLIITNIWAYATAAKTAQMVSMVREANRNDSIKYSDTSKAARHQNGMLFREKIFSSVSQMMTVKNIRRNALGGIISAIFTLLGAILMWHLKRAGFYLYLFGTLLGIAVPLILYGVNMMSVGISSFTGFFGLVFVALYALNFKNFNK